MTDEHIDELVRAFENHTLDQEAWNHEAHIAVCLSAVRRLGRDGALTHLRQAIRSYNEATGLRNTSTTGYHETITKHFVGVVAERADRDLATLLADPACDRDAPLRLWSRDVLFSPEARRRWVPPDCPPPTEAARVNVARDPVTWSGTPSRPAPGWQATKLSATIGCGSAAAAAYSIATNRCVRGQ